MIYRVMALVAVLLASMRVEAACTLSRMAELPVTMDGRQPIVTAKVNGFDARFLLDSGAFWSMIRDDDAHRFGMALKARGGDYEVVGVGGNASIAIATARTLTFSGKTITNIQFTAGTVNLLGQNILTAGDTEYDLANGMVRLISAKDCGNQNLAYWPGGANASVIAIETLGDGRHLTGTVYVNGMAVRAVFDTGANTSILNLPAAARLGIRPDSPEVKPSDQTHGIGAKTHDSWIAPFASFKVGDEEIRNTHLRIGDIGPDLGTDMLIGADFFLSHHIYVSKWQRKLYLTYNGGAVFDLSARGDHPLTPASIRSKLADADSYARRAAASFARGDQVSAFADIDEAIALAPKEPRLLYQRSGMYVRQGKRDLGRADLDAALVLDPRYADALIARAEYWIKVDKPDLARRDLDAAMALVQPGSDDAEEIADGYANSGAFDTAIRLATRDLDTHPADERRARLLNGRCWYRALSGRELSDGLADCNDALRLRAGMADALDSRGLVKLRMGNLAGAKADYNAALKASPKLANSLYGRAIVEIRSGDTVAGQHDMAAAKSIDPEIEKMMRRQGVMP